MQAFCAVNHVGEIRAKLGVIKVNYLLIINNKTRNLSGQDKAMEVCGI